MEAILNLSSCAVAFDDTTATNSPERVYFSWRRNQNAMQIANPQTNSYALAPGESRQLFSGVRSTSIDNTTQLTMTYMPAVPPLSYERYRFAWTGGTDPVFRTDRGLALSGRAITITTNENNTINFAAQSGDFTAVLVGDWVFIPSTLSGDAASPFDASNVGFWVVVGKNPAASTLNLIRMGDFSGKAETVTLSSSTQVQAFSATGVQVGDVVDISGGFSLGARRSMEIINVTAHWFEVMATAPMPVLETAVPGSSNIAFFSAAKWFVRVEVDQDCAIRLNGNTVDSDRISPWQAGDESFAGESTKVGPTWEMTLVNRSMMTLNATVITTE